MQARSLRGRRNFSFAGYCQGYGGTGCPEGTVSATLSPDTKSLSLLFDQYQISVGDTTGKSLDHKSCNIAIPVHVPQGMRVSVLKIDYRGFNHLPFMERLRQEGVIRHISVSSQAYYQ